MKKILLTGCIFAITVSSLLAQTNSSKKEVKKSIEVEEVDGELKVEVTEKIGNDETVKVYKGEEAKEYLSMNSKGNTFLFSEDDAAEKVIIIESDGASGTNYSWVSEDDFDIEIDNEEMHKELQKLKDELDQLSKEEINKRLESILEMEVAMKEMHISIEELNDDMDIFDEIDVEVEEKDGVVVITKTRGGTKEVEEIKMNGDNKNKKIVVMSTSKASSKSVGSTDAFDVDVYPNPNDGNFTIELKLKNDTEAKVKVIDAAGKEVYKKSVKGAEDHKLEVKLKKPSAGVYVVIVETG